MSKVKSPIPPKTSGQAADSNLNEIKSLPTHYAAEKKTEWTNGPDKLCPAESYFATRLDEAVSLRYTEPDLKKFPPLSVYTIFKQTVSQRPDHPALAFKKSGDDDHFTMLSYLEYWRVAHKAAKSFIKLGLEPSQCVCLLGFNSPHWFISLMGAIIAGGIGCGIYATNSVESCEFIMKDTNAKIFIVEDKQQLEKILKCKIDYSLTKIIQYKGKVDNNHNGLVIDWSEFIDFGLSVDDIMVDLRVKTLAPNKCISLIYTSGTTGAPKAAMISHDNVGYLIRYVGVDITGLKPFSERFVSYLPLSHIAAQLVDIFATMCCGATVYFAQPDALKGTLAKTLKEARPTFFFGVPRVWEKMQDGILKELAKLTGTKKSIFEWAQKTATIKILAQFSGRRSDNEMEFSLAKSLVLKKIHKELGLDKCRNFYSGAAPITKETLDFFISLGMPVCEVYGMSESTGPHGHGIFANNRVCSIGPVRMLNRSKLLERDDDGAGELAIYGRHVFMGYLNDRKKTDESFDNDGWLKTGDLAKIEDKFIFITGRLKELIITAGGENIPPVPIEDKLKAELPNLISNCMLVGDKKKYLVILVTLKCKIDLDTMLPTDDLTDECAKYLLTIGSTSKKVSHIIDHKDSFVYKAIEDAIKRVNDKSVSRAAKVQKFHILPRDFSLPNGELGPTLKMRRPIITKMYASVIDQLYADNSNTD